jgi:hypothetical protein
MGQKGFCLIGQLDDATLLQMAARVCEELELRGLPDVSFKQGYKAGFLAALRDSEFGPGQVLSLEQAKGLYAELEQRFAA